MGRVIVAPAETARAYDVWAQEYDSFDNPLVAMTGYALARAPLQVSGLRVVELGCGTGRNTARVLRQGAASYVGVDASEGMLARARESTGDGRVRWIHADVMSALPLEAGSADFVLISLVLEHFESLEPIFRAVHRLLAPGGRCRFLEIHPGLVEGGVQAHFWHQGVEHRLPSFPHAPVKYAQALAAVGLDTTATIEWYASDEAIERCAKLEKHRGRPVLVDVHGARPRELP